MDSNKSAATGQDRPPKPSALPVIPEQIPPELKALKQWVVWRYWWDEEAGKWTKKPLRPKDGNATSHNAKEAPYWTIFDFAYQRYQDSQGESWQFDGIGLVLVPTNQLVGFDLDDCRNPTTGELTPFAQEIVGQVLTYWECSPSGTGLRGFAAGLKPGSRCRNDPLGFEVYSSSRYLCISGHHLHETPATIEPAQAGIDAVYQQMFPELHDQALMNGSRPNGSDLEYPDDLILSAARRARNALDFITLYDQGDLKNYVHADGSPDPSRADLGLCRLMAFFTKHEDQLDRLFRASVLNRPKWESRADYRQWTLTKAIESTSDQWSGPSAAASNGHVYVSDEEEPPYHTSQLRDAPPAEDLPDEEIPIHLTDRGNALRLIQAHGSDLHYIYRWKKWLVWDGTRWKVDEGNRVEALAKQVIMTIYRMAQYRIQHVGDLMEKEPDAAEEISKARKKDFEIAMQELKWALKSESADRLAGMLRHARSERGIPITPEQLDANPWILNCRNGTIDLKTGTLHKHRRDDLCTKRIEVDYHPRARCKNPITFLYRIMGKPKADAKGLKQELRARRQRARRLVKFLQRAVGYSLTGVTQEAVLFFMYGTGDNGKSTFSETLSALLGPYFQKAPQELLMRKDRNHTGGPSPEIARLCGARLVMASEVSEHHRLNESQVKDLTGDDTLTARGLYEAFFDFRPTHKLAQ